MVIAYTSPRIGYDHNTQFLWWHCARLYCDRWTFSYFPVTLENDTRDFFFEKGRARKAPATLTGTRAANPSRNNGANDGRPQIIVSEFSSRAIFATVSKLPPPSVIDDARRANDAAAANLLYWQLFPPKLRSDAIFFSPPRGYFAPRRDKLRARDV